MTKTYDQKCYDLAEHFIKDCSPALLRGRRGLTHQLAIEIQTTIEDYFEGLNEKAEWGDVLLGLGEGKQHNDAP